jgi:hypothetical protein
MRFERRQHGPIEGWTRRAPSSLPDEGQAAVMIDVAVGDEDVVKSPHPSAPVDLATAAFGQLLVGSPKPERHR